MRRVIDFLSGFLAQQLHEHKVLGWQHMTYPDDFIVDDGSPKAVYKIGVGVCEGCRVPVMEYVRLNR